MKETNQQIFDKVLSLPVEARVDLVERLLSSLNTPTQKDVDLAWAAEAESRVRQIENGVVQLVDGESVFAAIRKKFTK
jgi:putative addiction module component (TIGR02574 family)